VNLHPLTEKLMENDSRWCIPLKEGDKAEKIIREWLEEKVLTMPFKTNYQGIRKHLSLTQEPECDDKT